MHKYMMMMMMMRMITHTHTHTHTHTTNLRVFEEGRRFEGRLDRKTQGKKCRK